MMRLLTIGYEAASVEDFTATLERANVNCVIDVRAIPLSRRPGFSKSALKGRLAAQGIDYVHLASLGDPKAGREAARAGRYEEFQRIFHAHLATATAQEGLQTTASRAQKGLVCLLCYERDPKTCHRSLVANALAKMHEFRIEHLIVRPQLHETRRAPRGGFGSRQSRSTTQPATW